MFDRARGRVADLGYAAGWGVVRGVPELMSARAFQAAADAATVRNGGGARQLRKNLRRVVGPRVSELQMDGIVGEALRSYARYWLETFRLPRMDKRAVTARADRHTTGRENLQRALDEGRGAVVALPHMGNWDIAGLWLVDHHGPFTTVVERLKPESLFDRFVAYRESLGFEIVPLTGGPRTPVEVLKQRLNENRVVCLIADRDLSRAGVEVQFFGEPARMPGGPALLAATTGAALLPVSLWFTGDSWAHQINPPIEVPAGRLRDQVPAVTQAMADVFARDIAQHPTDWHMLQPLWDADLPPRRQRARAGVPG